MVDEKPAPETGIEGLIVGMRPLVEDVSVVVIEGVMVVLVFVVDEPAFDLTPGDFFDGTLTILVDGAIVVVLETADIGC